MSIKSKPRWINTLVLESATHIPALPWERAAKRARRIALAQPAPVRAFA